jgi:hypothetical protein
VSRFGTAPGRPLAHEPLLSIGVARTLVAALVTSALGIGASVVGYGELAGILRTAGILIAATALVLLYARRGEDRLERIPAVSAVVMAIAGGLAAVGVIWLLNSGPDRPIGVVGTLASIGIVTAAASAAASTAVLIRPHVEPMVAHVWAGIGGAGLAIPFMAAGAAPEAIMAGAVLFGVADRAGHRRRARALEARERAMAGVPTGEADPRDVERRLSRGPALSRRERSIAVSLGLTAIGTVIVAWVVGIAVASGSAASAATATGQGFAAASLAAIPLAILVAMLSGSVTALKRVLVITNGMLGLASIALLVAPTDEVFLAAVAVQSIAVALLTGALACRAAGATTEGAVLMAIVAATAWWLVIVSSGGLLLAFAAVIPTLLAVRRRSSHRRGNAPDA